MNRARPYLASLVLGPAASLGCGGSGEPPQAPASPPPAATVGAEPTSPSPAPSPAAPTQVAAEAPSAAQAPSFPPSTPGNELTLEMLRALRGEKTNVVFSGASVRAALGMTALGAKGKTLDELAKALRLDPDPAKNVANARAERERWAHAAGKAELAIANRLWIDRAFSIDAGFGDQAKSGYGAAAAAIDFAASPEPSRQKINAWVGEATKGRIKDLLPPTSIQPTTRLVLTNAVYFKGSFAVPFPKAQTKDEPFQTAAGSTNAPMMHRTGTMAFAENAEVKLVELPYQNSDLSMLVALPNRPEQLDAIAAEVSGGEVDAWAKSLGEANVVLSMPKFSFSWGRSIKPELMTLGIRTAFDRDSADFSGIAPAHKEGLYVAEVFHKAFVLVDETGTEAAGATGVVMAPRGLIVRKTVEMKIDRPFLFFVRDRKTGEILFAGRVLNPRG